ncbi:melanoma-associated antigen C2-like [Aotus nancymaae]|uniref:melanoma-associated antigen C2-like n=1 Tax=Aotus nancymaae TaxID=37293 RepID=UPI0006267E6A|nr:melanoma-associated antigen C2-like [Aotus nancymaae]
MPLFPNSPSLNSEEDSQKPVVIEEWIDAHDPTNEDASSISSSTFYLLCPSSSSSSSSPLILGGPEEEEVSSAGMSSLPSSTPNSPPQGPSQCSPQNPLGSCSSFISGIPFNEEFSSQKEEYTSTFQGLLDSEPLLTRKLDEKVAELVQFLLLKYDTKEPITEAQMLMIAVRYKNYFPMIFEKAREFMEFLFGLTLIEVDPDHSYAFVNTVDPTDMGSDDQGTRKNSLLIVILSIIFIKGGCASEEAIWEVLNAIGVYAGREHFVYGEPGELVIKVWVEEGYLEYREVPNTSPPFYDFLWGPRAHSENIKRKVLEFLAKLNDTVPLIFPSWYKDALKDAEEGLRAIISTTDDATDMANRSFSFMSSNFSCPE